LRSFRQPAPAGQLGFSWRWPLSGEDPGRERWILSSESSLFNGLRSIEAGTVFLGPRRRARADGAAARGLGIRRGQDCSCGSITSAGAARWTRIHFKLAGLI